MMYDVKLYTGTFSLVAWREEYATVWDALDDAHNRAVAGKHEVMGISAIRAPERSTTEPPSTSSDAVVAERRNDWVCVECKRENPGWLFRCDACGRAKP